MATSARAVLEAAGLAVRHVAEPIRAHGVEVREMRVSGPTAQSAELAQLRSDVTGLPVAVPRVAESAALGAAILAAVGVGAYPDLPAAMRGMCAVVAHLRPREELRAVYDELYAIYRDLYPATAPLHASTGTPRHQGDPPMTLRTPRQPLLLVIALAAMLALLASSHGAVDRSLCDASRPPAQPVAGGTLTVGLAAEAESLDPYLDYQNSGISVVNAIFDTLVGITRDGSIGTGGLAESWSFATDTSLVLKLRPGVTFQDGSPFSADDVKFSIDRVKSDALASQLASNYGSVSSVTVVDPLTVRLDLSRPDASLIASLGTLPIVSKAYHDKVGDAGFATHPMGTGPFSFVEWVKDDHLTLTANPAYWPGSWKGWPLVQTVTFRPIPDAGTRVAELTTGGIDVMADLPADDVSLLAGTGASPVYLDDGHHVEIWLNTGGVGAGAIGSVAKDPTPEQKMALEALAKPEVRTALNMAIDRATIIDTLLQGYGSPLTSVFGDRRPAGRRGCPRVRLRPRRGPPDAGRRRLSQRLQRGHGRLHLRPHRHPRGGRGAAGRYRRQRHPEALRGRPVQRRLGRRSQRPDARLAPWLPHRPGLLPLLLGPFRRPAERLCQPRGGCAHRPAGGQHGSGDASRAAGSDRRPDTRRSAGHLPVERRQPLRQARRRVLAAACHRLRPGLRDLREPLATTGGEPLPVRIVAAQPRMPAHLPPPC